MKKIPALLFVLHSVLLVFGQTRTTLLQRLAIAKEDSNKVQIYNGLAFTYAWSDADTSIMYAEQGMDLAKKIHYDAGVARARLMLCAALTTMGNYSLALDNAFKALAFLEKTNVDF